MKIKVISALFGLAALWGASFLFIRIASPEMGPFATIQGRVTIAAIALLIYTACIGRSTNVQTHWKQYLILGALNAAIPFMLIATAAIHLNASMSAILNSLTPVFSALVAWGWIKEKLTFGKWAGIIAGIVGVAILVGWSSIPLSFEVIVAVGLSILSTVSYGFGGVYAKKAFAGVPPLSVAVGQQMGASILLIPFTLFNLPASLDSLTPAAIFSVVGVAIFCTAIAYPLFFYLISNAGPTKTQSVTLLIPLFGMIWGVIFLDEKITVGMITGLIVIMGSVFLIYDIQLPSTKSKKRQMLKS